MKEVVKDPEWNTAEYHRNEIVNIINKIEDSWILWQIHRLCVNITKED